jgi:hypothetical protein
MKLEKVLRFTNFVSRIETPPTDQFECLRSMVTPSF